MLRLFFPVVLSVLSLFSAEINAAPHLLLRCLAREENEFSQKHLQSPLSRLNQDFVNELASSNDINFKKVYVDEICSSEKANSSPSLTFLRLLLIKEHELYDFSLSNIDLSIRPFKIGYINEFQKQVPRIFVQYLANLQSELPTPRCLENKIPELAEFYNNLKHLEEEVPTHQLIKQKHLIETIFLRLKNFNSFKKECLQSMKQKKVRPTLP